MYRPLVVNLIHRIPLSSDILGPPGSPIETYVSRHVGGGKTEEHKALREAGRVCILSNRGYSRASK